MLGINPEEGQGAWQAFMKAKARGEKLVKVSIALGQDPVTWVVSGSKLNRAKADELEVVSAIRGRPLKVVRSETNAHLVPANSEMVIEGEVPLDQEMLPEGPFGEMYGYMGARKAANFWMNVTAITHRKNPVDRQPVHGGDPRVSDRAARASCATHHEALRSQREDVAYASRSNGSLLRQYQENKTRRSARGWKTYRANRRYRKSGGHGR